MKEKESTLESSISKDIYDAISPPMNPIIHHATSTPNLISKNFSLSLIEEEKSEQKDEDSNREYKIGNYMVKYTLGQGTFGKVKLGVYIPNDEKVAIKILEKNRIIEKDDEIRVKREFDMLAQFSHPNVILVAEIFESEDSYYSVMEFCEGGELFNYIVKKNRLCEDESAFFFFQLINGLEYIHSLGIVHRDLKPENLLLTSDHILKIIDFGLSNYFQTGQKDLLSTPCGSPCYASPEMVAGKKYDGFKIDVWSCGIILYAMLCGYLPFEDQDNEVLFKKILECKLEYPNYVNRFSIDLIEKILVTDPDKRITIDEIKKHPFYLKGKSIFEENFSINNLIQNPIEKVNSKKNVSINKDKNNENKDDNKEIENRNINVDINNEKEKEEADIGVKKIEYNKENEGSISNKKEVEEKINKKDKKIQKRRREKDENKNKNKLNIEINIDNKENNKKIDEKANSNHNNNNNNNATNKNDNNNNIIVLENDEGIYKPLKTEYNNNFNYNILANVKKIKEYKYNEKEKPNTNKKNSDISKENTLKKYFELNQKEKEDTKNKEKEKLKNKDAQNLRTKETKNNELYKIKKQEIMNITQKISTSKQKKQDEERNKSKKIITPKKIYHISKNVKSQRPSNITNISNKINLNLKINPKKYLQQKMNKYEKLISLKEPRKMKSAMNNNNNFDLNINKFSNYTPQIKSILNSFNSKKKEKENINYFNHLNTEENKINTNMKKNIDDNNIKNYNNINRLKTESNQNKNKTFLDKKYIFNNNTLDVNNTSVNRKKDINLDINSLKERVKYNDIKRIKSSNFNNDINHTNYNTKTYNTFFGKKINSLRNKPAELTYGINNYTNHKLNYETDIINNDINGKYNIIKTEPSSEIYTKLKNNIKNNRYNYHHFNFINKNKTNTNISSINPRRTNKNYPSSYLKYFNIIKKAPTYNTLKTMNLKGIPMTTSDILNNKKKLNQNQNQLKDKKNQQVTIRNTVINFNMIDTGIILPSFKKIKNDKKIPNLNNNNIDNRRLLSNRKYPKELNNDLNSINTLDSLNTIDDNKYKNTMKQFSYLNNNSIRPYGTSTITQDNKRNSALSSFNKLVNKIKNKQKYNRIQFNKIHNKYKSMKLNDFIRTNKNEKKNSDILNINYNTNMNNNTINNTITSTYNRLKNINNDKNLTLPSLINKNKKYTIPKGKKYLIKSQGKVIKLYNSFKDQNNNINDNYKSLSIKEISNL